MCQPVAKHAFDEDEDGGRVDLDISLLIMVMRLDGQRVVAEAEAQVGLAERGAQERDLTSCA